MANPSRFLTLSAALFSSVLVGCGDNPTGPNYEPDIPSDLSSAVTNPLLAFVPGTTQTYEGDTQDGLETITVEVLNSTKTIMGVSAIIVHDQVFLEGDLIEDTYDWYAQDGEGNVWYLGEDSREIENGQVVSTDGSWEWGVDGALPGIIMWGNPGAHVGEEYRQEYYKGEAEDWGRVVSLDESVTVPYGSFTGCLKTEEWNALEKKTLEAKYYCPGVGFLKEVKLQGGNEVVELVSVSN